MQLGFETIVDQFTPVSCRRAAPAGDRRRLDCSEDLDRDELEMESDSPAYLWLDALLHPQIPELKAFPYGAWSDRTTFRLAAPAGASITPPIL